MSQHPDKLDLTTTPKGTPTMTTPRIGTAASAGGGWRIPIERVERIGGAAYARCEPPGRQAVASSPRPHDFDDSTLIADIAELLGSRWTCSLLPHRRPQAVTP